MCRQDKQRNECIREYFIIARIRYEERFQLDIDVKDQDLQLLMLKLILQPVVENAMKYGFSHNCESGTIKIVVTRHEKYLEIQVMDNGQGMSKERQEEIEQRLASNHWGEMTEKGWSKVGLKNIYDRIQKKFGTEYGFQIASQEEIGTVVQFCLPIIEGDINVEGIVSR